MLSLNKVLPLNVPSHMTIFTGQSALTLYSSRATLKFVYDIGPSEFYAVKILDLFGVEKATTNSPRPPL